MALDDETFMPFGKYGPGNEHLRMKEVPAPYLLWLWDNVLWYSDRQQHAFVKEYVRSHFKQLLGEHTDYIPEHPPEH